MRGGLLFVFREFLTVGKLLENIRLVLKFSFISAKFWADNFILGKFRGNGKILSTHNRFCYVRNSKSSVGILSKILSKIHSVRQWIATSRSTATPLSLHHHRVRLLTQGPKQFAKRRKRSSFVVTKWQQQCGIACLGCAYDPQISYSPAFVVYEIFVTVSCLRCFLSDASLVIDYLMNFFLSMESQVPGPFTYLFVL